MNILVHHIFYRPEPIGNGTYTGEMCEWLVRHGHSVDVVCPPPYYPFWKVQSPYNAARYQSEVIAGVRVTRCPIWVPGKGGLKRLLYALSFAVSSFPVMLKRVLTRPDVVLVIEPSFLNTISSLILAKLSGSLVWLHVQDFEIDIAFDLQQFRSPRLRSWVTAAESWIMRRFDVVSSISAPMMDRLRQKGVADRRSVYFPNWVDTRAIYPVEKPPAGRITALYSGTTGAKQGLDVLIDAARLLQRRTEIEIVIRGAGTEPLRKRAAGLANVRFLPLVPLDRLNESLNTADIHLLPQKRSVADLVMPSKLLGMVASGRPVIATADQGTELANAVSSFGIVVPPEDPAALANAIHDLAGDPERRLRLGRMAREYAASRCEKDVILAAFERELLSRLAGRDAAELAIP